MKLFDKVKPIYFIDDEMNMLLNDIDNKLLDIEINDKKKENIWLLNQKLDRFIRHFQ